MGSSSMIGMRESLLIGVDSNVFRAVAFQIRIGIYNQENLDHFTTISTRYPQPRPSEAFLPYSEAIPYPPPPPPPPRETYHLPRTPILLTQKRNHRLISPTNNALIPFRNPLKSSPSPLTYAKHVSTLSASSRGLHSTTPHLTPLTSSTHHASRFLFRSSRPSNTNRIRSSSPVLSMRNPRWDSQNSSSGPLALAWCDR